MAKLYDDPGMQRVVTAMRWRLKQIIGDRVEWDELDEEFLTIAAEAGAFVKVCDLQQECHGPLATRLADVYGEAFGNSPQR
jgi:hypothetical protein